MTGTKAMAARNTRAAIFAYGIRLSSEELSQCQCTIDGASDEVGPRLALAPCALLDSIETRLGQAHRDSNKLVVLKEPRSSNVRLRCDDNAGELIAFGSLSDLFHPFLGDNAAVLFYISMFCGHIKFISRSSFFVGGVLA